MLNNSVSFFTPTLTLGLGVLRRSTTCIHAGVPHQGGGNLILNLVLILKPFSERRTEY